MGEPPKRNYGASGALWQTLWLALLFVGPPAPAAAAGPRGESSPIAFTLTAQNTSDRLTPQTPLSWAHPGHRGRQRRGGGASRAAATATVLTVDLNQTYQTIEGFGGAFTEAAAHVFASMPAALQEQLLELYFGDTGLRYSMGRLTIGSCDFSLTHYNYDDVRDDFNLTRFSVAHDEAEIVPFIRRAIQTAAAARRTGAPGRAGRLASASTAIKFVASPWSAPGWMKENNAMDCSLGPWTCVLKPAKNGAYKQAWAEYVLINNLD